MNIIETNLSFKSMTWENRPNKIILHNADASICTVYDIHQWHLNNGWSGIGYHYFVRKDGSVYKGRPDNAVGSHCQGSNTNSIGICFEGKYMSETMPQVQYDTGIELIKYLLKKYGDMPIYGHKDLYNTDCPGINFPLSDFKNLKVKSSGEWIKQDGKWWYKHSDGSYTKQDFELIDGEWYYFDVDGWMITGWLYLTSTGCYYRFDENGHMYHDCVEDGYQFDENGHATKI